MLEQLGINANFIRADRTYLQFSSVDSVLSFSYAAMLKKSVSLPRSGGEGSYPQDQDGFTQSDAEEIIEAILRAMVVDQEEQPIRSGGGSPIEDPLLFESGNSSIAHEGEIAHSSNINAEPTDVTIDAEEHSTDIQGAFGPLLPVQPIEPQESNASTREGVETEEISTNTLVKIVSNIPKPLCPFCNTAIEDSDSSVKLTQKGVLGIVQAAKKREDNLDIAAGQEVHQQCRSNYTNPINLDLVVRKRVERERSESPNLRSHQASFSFRTQCFYCGFTVDPEDPNVFRCRQLGLKQPLLEKCDERNDDVSNVIRGWLESVNDLHAADAVYHTA